MKNIVLIPTWQREDFLSVNLDYIKASDKCDQNTYLFLLDRRYNPEIDRVISTFPLEKIVHRAPRHQFHGNSYNLLEGYRIAANQSREHPDRLVYLIEEDIFIAKDFFTFHEKVQSKYDPFCVSAVYCHAKPPNIPNEPSLVYEHLHYQSLGVSFKAKELKLFTVHANPQYYRSMVRYCLNHFPDSKLASMHTEQDGVINRVVEKVGRPCIYPYTPRAFHAGAWGYNRKGKPLTGTLESRVQSLKNMSKEEFNNRADVYKDIEPIDLTLNHNIAEYTLAGL